MTRPGIEPRSPGPLANTLTARPMSGTKIDVVAVYSLETPEHTGRVMGDGGRVIGDGSNNLGT